jgi:hypothetical protein
MSSYSGQSSSKPTSKLKPVLRKFTQSEKNSLDLNRPAIEQGFGFSTSDYGTGSRTAYDVSFQSMRRGYHNRSTSGTSQFSTNTTGSGHRAGSFVHPFQQTPRPYTPPLATASYAGSLRGSEYSRDSPVFPDDDEPCRPNPTFRAASSLSNISSSTPGPPALRLQTKVTSTSRLGNSQSNIPPSFSNLSQDMISPVDTISPASAIRTSIDRGHRIRSHSQVDSRARTESIREARRKFEEKELAKEQKAQLAEVKAIERQNLREAKQMEKSARKSSVSETTRPKQSKSDLTAQEKGGGFIGRDYNSVPVLSPPLTTDEIPEPPRRTRTGASTTKKKTHSAWTQFMMWLRTRFLRMGKRRATGS